MNNINLKINNSKKRINRIINKILKIGFNNINLDTLSNESKKIYEFSSNINYDYGIGYSFYFQGVIYNYLSKFKDSLILLEKAYKIFDELKDSLSLARVCLPLGNNYTERNIYYKGLVYYQKVLRLSKKSKKIRNSDIIIKALNNIGVIYLKNNLPAIAREYFLKAKDIAYNKNFYNHIPIYLENIAITYRNQKDFNKSIEYFNEAIKNLKSIKIKTNETRGLSLIYYEMGVLYLLKKDYDEAYFYFMNTIFYSMKINNNLQIINSTIGLLKVFYKLKKTYKFKEALLFTLKQSRKIGAIEPILEIYKLFHLFYFNIEKNYKLAYKFLKKYFIIKRKLLNSSLLNKLNNEELEVFHLMQDKEIEIYEIKNKKIKEKNYEIRNTLNLIKTENSFSINLLKNIFKEKYIRNNNIEIFSFIPDFNKNLSIVDFYIKDKNNLVFIIIKTNSKKIASSFIIFTIFTYFIKYLNLNFSLKDIFDNILYELNKIIKSNNKNKKHKGEIKNLIIGMINLEKLNLKIYSIKKFSNFIVSKNKIIKLKYLLIKHYYYTELNLKMNKNFTLAIFPEKKSKIENINYEIFLDTANIKKTLMINEGYLLIKNN